MLKVIGLLLKICKQEDILPEQLQVLHDELISHGNEIRDLLNNDTHIFTEVYGSYLENLNDNDIADVKSKLQTGLFEISKSECNIKVRKAAEEFREKQLKSQLFSLWKDKTGTRNPREWSSRYRTPILCCVCESEYLDAKKAFETLNRNSDRNYEILPALAYLESSSLFPFLSDAEKRNEAFMRDIIGEYSILLPGSRRSILLIRTSTFPLFASSISNKTLILFPEVSKYTAVLENSSRFKYKLSLSFDIQEAA